MTDEELLAKARRDYPVGTQFIHVKGDGKTIKTIYDTNEFSIPYNGIIWAETGNGVLYYDGKWAKIVNKVNSLKLYKIL